MFEIKVNYSESRTTPWLLGLILVFAGMLAWSNSFGGPFIFDDILNIQENRSIREFPPPWNPESSQAPGIASRPLVYFSLAANYAVSGVSVWSYHAFNLLAHLLAALALFGLVRRSLAWEKTAGTFGPAAPFLAFFCACLWLLHPLQTASVTYLIQRCESLMGMCFLCSLYLAVRGWQSKRPGPWHAGSVFFCFLGAGAKEVIAVLPVVALAYDWMFVHPGLGAALKKSRLLYAGYAACLAFVAYLVASGGTLGGALVQYSALQYMVTQPEVILHYLGLALWPANLCLDYLWPAASPSSAALPGLLLLGLLAVSARAFFQKKAAGFLGVWFFATLAPSSSIVPLADLAFEHRMYLALAPVIAFFVLGGYAALVRFVPRPGRGAALAGGAALLVALAVVLGGLTYLRNQDFSTEAAIWEDVREKRPENPRACNNLGRALANAGDLGRAIALFEKALSIKEDYAEAHMNLGTALAGSGKPQRALESLERSLALDPENHKTLNNLGSVLHDLGRTGEAVFFFNKAVEQSPHFAQAHANLTLALATSGRVKEALASCEEALSLGPRLAEAHLNCGVAHVQAGKAREAMAFFGEAAALNPHSVSAHTNLGILHARQGNSGRAVFHTLRALSLGGPPGPLHSRLGELYLGKGDFKRAVFHYEKTVALNPKSARNRINLGVAWLSMGELDKAGDALAQALEMEPSSIRAHYNMACVTARGGNADAALKWLEKAIALGFSKPHVLQKDQDLKSLWKHPGFLLLITRLSE